MWVESANRYALRRGWLTLLLPCKWPNSHHAGCPHSSCSAGRMLESSGQTNVQHQLDLVDARNWTTELHHNVFLCSLRYTTQVGTVLCTTVLCTTVLCTTVLSMLLGCGRFPHDALHCSPVIVTAMIISTTALMPLSPGSLQLAVSCN